MECPSCSRANTAGNRPGFYGTPLNHIQPISAVQCLVHDFFSDGSRALRSTRTSPSSGWKGAAAGKQTELWSPSDPRKFDRKMSDRKMGRISASVSLTPHLSVHYLSVNSSSRFVISVGLSSD